MTFLKDQKIMYLKNINDHVDGIVVDPGSTLTTIMICSIFYDLGHPTYLLINNNDIIDYDRYTQLKRDGKIIGILNE